MRWRTSPSDAEPTRSERSGGVPLDFMHHPDWTPLATDALHGRLTGRDVTRLLRRDRDYVYRIVANLDSTITVDRALEWYRESPSGTTAGLVGAAKVRQARRIRGTRRVQDLGREEGERYAAILADAETQLKNACARYPDALLPWVPRLDIARGLRMGLAEIRRRYVEAQSRERWNYLASEAAFLGHTSIWAGSFENMFSFAADALVTPPGHPTRSLVASAEAERLLRDPKASLDLMPTRELLDLHAQFAAYVEAMPDDPDPDDVVGLGAFLAVIEPRDAEEAALVQRALTLVQRRCGGHPYTLAANPLKEFTRVIERREKQAAALLR